MPANSIFSSPSYNTSIFDRLTVHFDRNPFFAKARNTCLKGCDNLKFHTFFSQWFSSDIMAMKWLNTYGWKPRRKKCWARTSYMQGKQKERCTMQSFSKLGTQSRKINSTSKVTQHSYLCQYLHWLACWKNLKERLLPAHGSAVKGAHIKGLPSLCCPITMLAPTTVTTAFLTSQQQTQMSIGLLSGPLSPYCAPLHPTPNWKQTKSYCFRFISSCSALCAST